MNEARNFTPVPGDNPISDDGDDVLERADVANAFVRKVLELDTRHGTAVGVFAPWGSGKTSFINLARKTFECKGVRVLDFNPWLFSGAEQLVERFFAELSVELKQHDLEAVGKALEGYGDAFYGLSGKVGIVELMVALAVGVLGAMASGGALSGLSGEVGIVEAGGSSGGRVYCSWRDDEGSRQRPSTPPRRNLKSSQESRLYSPRARQADCGGSRRR